MVSTVLLSVLALPFASAYSQSRAEKYANLAGAAYCSGSSLESWSCGSYCSEDVTNVKVCQGSTTLAFVGLWEGKALVSFRGTHGVNAMIQDLKVVGSGSAWSECSGCYLHSGFLGEWNSMKTCIKGHLSNLGSRTIRTTGHSLGAALSIIAAVELHYDGYTVDESYDFGRPRTGSAEFAQTCESLFGSKVNRVTHRKDPVVQLPPDRWGIINWYYEHSGPEIFYNGALSGGHVTCTSVDDKTCSAQYWNVITGSVEDHLSYMDMGIAGCSVAEVLAANVTLV